MAVKLRLVRMGKPKQPTYRVVAADSRSPRNGRFIEILGTYEPRAEPSVVKIDNEKAKAWLLLVTHFLAASNCSQAPEIFSSFCTVSVGCAPLVSQPTTLSLSIFTTDGSARGS